MRMNLNTLLRMMAVLLMLGVFGVGCPSADDDDTTIDDDDDATGDDDDATGDDDDATGDDDDSAGDDDDSAGDDDDATGDDDDSGHGDDDDSGHGDDDDSGHGDDDDSGHGDDDDSAGDDDDSASTATPGFVTFNIDMNCPDHVGGAASFTTVHVTGPFCGWCGSEAWNTASDPDGDGVYTLDLLFVDAGGAPEDGSTMEYKAMVDGFADQEDLVDDMQAGGSCAPVTDYSSYANRQVVATATGDSANVVADIVYGSCDPCSSR